MEIPQLLKPTLLQIDEEDTPCYLDTRREKNVGSYEHFGLKVIAKKDIPDTELTGWAMLRELGWLFTVASV